MLNAALVTLYDEHRSLTVVVHGLKYLLRELRAKNLVPDFNLLRAMTYYIGAFPEKLHHPKEDLHLFARLRARTHAADTVLDQLEKQHQEGAGRVRALSEALRNYEAEGLQGFGAFAAAAEVFAEETLQHMNLEEKIVLPLASKYLTPGDWIDIAQAFGENGDPRFGDDTENQFRELFSRIVNLAPPDSGTGPKI